MNTLLTILGSLTGCFLIGCACDHSKPAVASKPDKVTVAAPTATFSVTTTGAAPLAYQWNFVTNGNLTTIVSPATNR